jgi:hypothetical protein
MKKIILLVTILMSTMSFSQIENDSISKSNDLASKKTKFTFDSKGLNPNILSVSVKSLKKNELTTKAKAWIKIKKGNTEKVVDKTDSDSSGGETDKNVKIQFSGTTHNAFCFGLKSDYKCEDLTYSIELTIKNRQYKFKPLSLSYTSTAKSKGNSINLKKSDFHNNNGEVKEEYEKIPSQIETLFNNMNKSLLHYLNDEDQETEW